MKIRIREQITNILDVWRSDELQLKLKGNIKYLFNLIMKAVVGKPRNRQ